MHRSIANEMKDTRRILKFVFDAPAELIVEETGERWQCRIKDLGIRGCHINASVTLKIGTPVIIKIFGREEFFEARAVVTSAHRSRGMGLGFRSIKPAFVPILQKWLVRAMQNANAQSMPGGER